MQSNNDNNLTTVQSRFHKIIWTALIAMLVLKFLQLKSKLAWSLSNLVAMLRWNLFTYRYLWVWLDELFILCR